MTEKLLDELSYLQERMHRGSKKIFREYLKTKAEKENLEFNIFPKSFASKNVVIGNLKKAKYVLVAHYDTPPRMPAFLMKSLLLFNLISVLFVVLTIILLLAFELPLIIGSIIWLISFLYISGFGVANKFNYNDNTSGVLTLLELMQTLKNKEVAYVFFDNEEKGLLGSIQLAFIMNKVKSYQPRKKVFINLDCVGRGNVFGIASFKNKIIAQEMIDLSKDMHNSNLNFEHKKPNTFEASDHFSFKNWNSLGIMCYNKKNKKYRLNNIHSHCDKHIDLENINVLVNLLKKYIDKDVEYDG